MPPSEARVQLSVLDRLIDEQPGKAAEAPLTTAQALRQYRAAVRRDLEWLLNTRRTYEPPEDGGGLLGASVYAYGLPDFSSFSAGSVQTRARLLSALGEIIQRFEPRIMNVEVLAVETDPDAERTSRQMHFLISGLLRMDPVPEQVTFDTRLEIGKGEYRVQEA